MSSLPDDRTAKARIRDEALRLFGERGPDAVTIRDVAAAAAVSPALVIRHYGSKSGLREAVDEHVVRVFAAMLAKATASGGDGPFDPGAVPSLAEAVAGALPVGSAVPGYLGWLLLGGGPAASALFGELYALSRDVLADMAAAGTADVGADPEVRAAFLLVNDLAVLILRDRLGEVLDVDPLSADGMRRWGAEVFAVYRNGLGDPAAGPN
ncbi:TetR/AcrR family transcriptional regulator [Amycolatopsis benzoatilytica]|uniref:TetR/AcrR family transcriptional regulator n=1 Tax=Amycolatopsis benzoatilytica TaxID=346045 RepID=UPI00037EB633|nr:TetR/AcrR family transcriptional regulator [Amycolatopsis benzoatilytica]